MRTCSCLRVVETPHRRSSTTLRCACEGAAARAENGAWRAKPAAKEEAIALMREKGMPRSAIDVAEACDRFFDVGVHYHDVMESWSDADGVVALVGDACHAMPPFLGQGANQAIQDALCVANELAKVGCEHKTVKDALKTYENIRKPPTAAIMQSSRFIGVGDGGGTDERVQRRRVLRRGNVRYHRQGVPQRRDAAI